MNSLKPISPKAEIISKKIRFFWLLMNARYFLTLGHGVIEIEPDGLVFSPSIESMAFLLSSLRKMTECWTDKSEALSSMKKFIGKFLILASSGKSLKPFYFKMFSSQSEDGTHSKRKWVCICLLPERNFIGFMILVSPNFDTR